ncbi:MAG: endonuclease III domain-containing protein [Aggregatilineales bacterium]
MATKMPAGVDPGAARQKYPLIAAALEEIYGRKHFKGNDGMDELISCILSQSTTDANRDRGFNALKEAYPTWAQVHHAPLDELVDTIRPAGLANSKAPRIQQSLEVIYDSQGDYNIDFIQEMSAEDASAWLQALPGVGPKTAAIVLCFAYDMPAFPVDTHVHRVGKRIGFLPEKISANKAHPVMEAIVPSEDYYAFHLQLIYHGRAICKARNPQCDGCPISAHCNYYEALVTDISDKNKDA